MNFKKIHLSLLLISVIPAVHAATPNCSSLVGDWKNQVGATMTISSIETDTGQVKASYLPATPTAKPIAVSGWVSIDTPALGNTTGSIFPVLSLSLRGGRGNITSWNGYCSDKGGTPTITTIWMLLRSASEFAFDHMLTNTDVFTPK